MAIDTELSISSGLQFLTPSTTELKGETGIFASLLGDRMSKDENTSDNDNLVDNTQTQKKGKYTGYFKKIEEEKLEKIREEVLAQMGLTEEKLAGLPAEQRSAIEKTISEKIQQRMAMSSRDNDENETLNNQTSGGQDAAQALSGMNTQGLLTSSFTVGLLMNESEDDFFESDMNSFWEERQIFASDVPSNMKQGRI